MKSPWETRHVTVTSRSLVMPFWSSITKIFKQDLMTGPLCRQRHCTNPISVQPLRGSRSIFRRQRLMYSTRVCSLVNLRGGWVGRGGNPPCLPTYPPPTYPPTPPPTHLPPPPTYPPPPTHPQLASSSTDTFKQRENQNKEKLTKVAAYEL